MALAAANPRLWRPFLFTFACALIPAAVSAMPAPKDLPDTAPKSLELAPESAAKGAMHIMIDPGHGGKDAGAIRGSLHESDIALKVSLKLAEQLKKDPRFRVSMTRTEDEALSLPRRAKIANEAKVDLFISVHLNSSSDPRARGKEFYFQNQLPADEESLFLASRENAEHEVADAHTRQSDRLSPQTDLKRILEDLNRNERIFASSELTKALYETWLEGGKVRKTGSRAIRQAPFFVISNVNSPSVLVELGFLTHQHEGPQLGQAAYQDELAESLYKGLAKYKEIVDKDR